MLPMTGRGCSEKGGLRGGTVVKNEIQKPDSHLPYFFYEFPAGEGTGALQQGAGATTHTLVSFQVSEGTVSTLMH